VLALRNFPEVGPATWERELHVAEEVQENADQTDDYEGQPEPAGCYLVRCNSPSRICCNLFYITSLELCESLVIAVSSIPNWLVQEK